MSQVSDLVGLTMSAVEVDREKDEILFTTSDGDRYKLYHEYDCCEGVSIEDVCGEPGDLVGSPLLMAEEVTSRENPDGVVVEDQEYDSFTWTFYKFATVRGYVTVRWYGQSNGYYSESVDFAKFDEGEGEWS